MTTAQQQQAARNFAAYWKDKGYEKGQSQPFWLSLLGDVLGMEHPEDYISFEDAKKQVIDALSVLGNEYIEKLKFAFDNNWIDVYKKKNKKVER